MLNRTDKSSQFRRTNQSMEGASRKDIISDQKSRKELGVPQEDDRKMIGSKESEKRSQIKIGSHQQSRKTLRGQDEEEKGAKVIGEGRLDEYGEEEEDIVCLRFPHLSFCPYNYQSQLKETLFVEIQPGIYLCGFAMGLWTKFLLQKAVTNVLNLTSMEYTKRTKYFKYLNIDVHNTSDEDIKKHFRISNRFIRETLLQKGKVLIHCRDGLNIGPCFILAYLINEIKVPLKLGIEMLQSLIPQLDIAVHFYKQLEQYDLEKLALLQIKTKDS
ncbi:unnamed protein product [Paramecium pentaurelia]|uniref:Tyrosine-protein phosphatase domain-containing protein n=1 Tax=Paramecium pentaurelia TaxID=43138 RepID=A0A8S1V8K4_9CILI|nr:unnamed protein product [Paramecium pentaurelia]